MRPWVSVAMAPRLRRLGSAIASGRVLTGMVIVTWLMEAALSTFLVSLTIVLYASLRGEKEGTTPAEIAAGLA